MSDPAPAPQVVTIKDIQETMATVLETIHYHLDQAQARLVISALLVIKPSPPLRERIFLDQNRTRSKKWIMMKLDQSKDMIRE